MSVYSHYATLAPAIQYIDFVIDNVSGFGPFVFRRALSIAPTPAPGAGPSPTPAVIPQGQAVLIAPGVSLTFSQVEAQNGSVSWQGLFRNDSNAHF